MNVLNEWKDGLAQAWESLAEGWRHVKERASGALTPFRPTQRSAPPADATGRPLATMGWGFLGVDVFDDDATLVVRLEAPGLDKDDFDIEVVDDALVVRGEKRFEREATHANYRVIQCAYGGFQRVVPLPVPVQAEHARAKYRNGVLRIELPKAEGARIRRIAVTQA